MVCCLMSDNKFSDELKIANSLKSYLSENQFKVLQLVHPGGQATYSLAYTNINGSIAHCFPDVIAIQGQRIFLGEIKPKYSVQDKKKLLKICSSLDGKDNLVSLVRKITGIKEPSRFYVWPIIIHGDKTTKPDDELDQLIVTQNETLLIKKVSS